MSYGKTCPNCGRYATEAAGMDGCRCKPAPAPPDPRQNHPLCCSAHEIELDCLRMTQMPVGWTAAPSAWWDAEKARADKAEAHARELYEESIDAAKRYKIEIDEAEARIARLEAEVAHFAGLTGCTSYRPAPFARARVAKRGGK